MTTALEEGEWSATRPGCTLPLGKTRYPFYRRLGGPQGWSGRAENLVPTKIYFFCHNKHLYFRRNFRLLQMYLNLTFLNNKLPFLTLNAVNIINKSKDNHRFWDLIVHKCMYVSENRQDSLTGTPENLNPDRSCLWPAVELTLCTPQSILQSNHS